MTSGVTEIIGAVGTIVTTILVVARAENFKKYLIACEYLQIDPAKVYDLDFLITRIEIVRTHWSKSDEIKQVKKLYKRLKWFEKKYLRLVKKGFGNYNFANECEIVVNKGKIKIHEGTVNDTYVKCELSQKNYDFYLRYVKKLVFIVFGVLLVIILIAAFLLSN